MNLTHLIHRIAQNAVMALGCLFAIFAAGEYLVPGFASPFIDIVHLGLVLFIAAVCVTMFASQQEEPFSVWMRIWQGAMIIVALIGGGILLWANLNTGSTADMVLLAAYAILSAIVSIATLLAL